MKISILHYAAPPIVGGVESTILHHSRLLRGSGYEVEVIAGRGAEFDQRVPFHLLPEIDSRHPEILKIGNALANGLLPDKFSSLRDYLFQKISPLVKEADGLIVHNILSLHKNLPLTAALKQIIDQDIVRMIAWCHDFAWQDELYTQELHSGYPWDLLRTKWEGVKYVAVSTHRNQMLASMIGASTQEIEVIPPGIDVVQFLNISRETKFILDKLNLLEAEPLLLLPARITRRKNIELGIQILAALVKKHPQAVLIVTGPPGPHNPKNIAYLKMLSDLRKEFQLESHVFFLYEFMGDGEISNISDEIVASLYRISDVLLFPSQREGFGIPILEAGLVRMPIFSADIPPVRESSDGYANYFHPEGDPEAIASEIHSHLTTDQAYLLKRRVINNFTWQSILDDKIIPLLDELGN